MTTGRGYRCTKCDNGTFEQDEIRMAGKWSRFFDVQNKKFFAVSCERCGYTEIYRGKGSTAANVLDFLSG